MMHKIYVSTASALASGGSVTIHVTNDQQHPCRVMRVECEALVTDGGAPGGYREEGKQYITGRLQVVRSATTESYPTPTARPLTLWADGQDVVTGQPFDLPREGGTLFLQSGHPSGSTMVHVVLHCRVLDESARGVLNRHMRMAGG